MIFYMLIATVIGIYVFSTEPSHGATDVGRVMGASLTGLIWPIFITMRIFRLITKG